METLQDILGGVAPFPKVHDHITDSEWADSAENGTIIWAEYPGFEVLWEDGMISMERVEY